MMNMCKCGNCKGPKIVLKFALAARDLAAQAKRSMIVLALGINVVVAPTKANDTPGVDDVMCVVAPESSDDEIAEQIKTAYGRLAQDGADILLAFFAELMKPTDAEQGRN